MFPLARAGQAPTGAPSPRLLSDAPGLLAAAEQVLASVVKSLQAMAGQATVVGGTVGEIVARSAADTIAACRPEHVVAAISCDGIPCTLLAILDAALVHAVVELLAGGNGAEGMGAEPRPATNIDAQFAHTLVALTAAAIETDWSGFGKVRAARLEGAPATDILGARVAQVGVITLNLGLFNLSGALRLVLPPAALQAFREGGDQSVEEVERSDPVWTDRFQRELGRAPVKVEAYLSVQAMPIGAIARLQVGQVLNVSSGARCAASLVCDGRTLFRGELGQDDGRYALRLDEAVPERPLAPRRAPSFAKAH